MCHNDTLDFEPTEPSQIAEIAESYRARNAILPVEVSALKAITNALQLRPDATRW